MSARIFRLLADRSQPSRWLIALLLGSYLPLAVAADRPLPKNVMYRYVNEQGVKVLNHTIPPEYAQHGYEIVNKHGEVLRTVDPSVDAAYLEEEKLRIQQEEERRQWDRDLLKRYSTVADVEAAKSRRLAEIETSIAILHGNIRSLDSQIAREQAKAAEQERQGRNISESILVNIENFKVERVAAERQIEAREQDYQAMSDRFDRDIERFRVIQEALSQRR